MDSLSLSIIELLNQKVDNQVPDRPAFAWEPCKGKRTSQRATVEVIICRCLTAVRSTKCVRRQAR